MKIVHLCLACFFPDGFSYQENLLPKFHKKLGHDVEVIASTLDFDGNGNPCYKDKIGSYINEHGIPVTRLALKYGSVIGQKLKLYVGTLDAIEKAKPDVLFIHGCQFCDISAVVKYLKRNRNVITYVDNHADFSNSAIGWVSRNILHKIIWRHYAQMIDPFVKKWYGVLPARVDFLKEMYGLPSEKIEFLPMGADDEFVEKYSTEEIRAQYRRKYGISRDEFLIVSGGKIDLAKKQTLLLMDAVNQINNPRIKLIVFGSIVPELKEEVIKKCSEKVRYIGWISSEQSYPHFAMADLVVFPGRHSVFWEQVVGMGIPMVVKRWDGSMHVDCGGNALFLLEDSTDEIVRVLKKTEKIECIKMLKQKAMSCKKIFSYESIAKNSLV